MPLDTKPDVFHYALKCGHHRTSWKNILEGELYCLTCDDHVEIEANRTKDKSWRWV